MAWKQPAAKTPSTKPASHSVRLPALDNLWLLRGTSPAIPTEEAGIVSDWRYSDHEPKLVGQGGQIVHKPHQEIRTTACAGIGMSPDTIEDFAAMSSRPSIFLADGLVPVTVST